MNDNDFEVNKLTEEQMNQITGGAAASTKEHCSNCNKQYATKGGYVVRDDKGGTLQIDFRGNTQRMPGVRFTKCGKRRSYIYT